MAALRWNARTLSAKKFYMWQAKFIMVDMSALMCVGKFEWKNRDLGHLSSKFGLEHSVL